MSSNSELIEIDQLGAIEDKFIELASLNPNIIQMFTQKVSGEFKISRQPLNHEIITGFPKLSIYSLLEETYKPQGNTLVEATSNFAFEVAVDFQSELPDLQLSLAKKEMRRLLISTVRAIKSSKRGLNLGNLCSLWYPVSLDFSPILSSDNTTLIYSAILKVRVEYNMSSFSFS